MTRTQTPTLYDVLTTYVETYRNGNLWDPGYRDRLAEATQAVIDTARALAESGDRDALRLWGALEQERRYAENNAALGMKLYRTVPHYGPILDGEHSRLTADANPPSLTDDAAWCGMCGRMREVEDTHEESHYEPWGEVGYQVTDLACGHSLQGEGRRIGAAPGAPYAGPGVATAATARPRDLRGARARQDALDHPYGTEWDTL